MIENRPRGRKPTIDRDAVFALDARGWTQVEIAEHLGVQQSAISKIIAKGAATSDVQPVAPPDDMEIVPRPTLRPVEPSPPPVPQFKPALEGHGSEWRGVALGQTLAERFRQLRVMQGDQVARDFARREAWHLTRTGVSVEALSQQLDLPVAEVEALIAQARERALAAIDTYDARLSLSAALTDIELARREALRVLNSASAAPSARASARHMLLRCAEAESSLAVTIESYRAAHGLGDGDTGKADMDQLSYWMPELLKKGPTR